MRNSLYTVYTMNWLEEIRWIAINDDIIPMSEIKRIQQMRHGSENKLIVDTPTKRYEVLPGNPGFMELSSLWFRIQQMYERF